MPVFTEFVTASYVWYSNHPTIYLDKSEEHRTEEGIYRDIKAPIAYAYIRYSTATTLDNFSPYWRQGAVPSKGVDL